VAKLIGYPVGRVLAVFDRAADADRAIGSVGAISAPGGGAGARGVRDSDARGVEVERFEGSADADRFDATGQRHGPVARVLRTVQFSLMDQLPAMAWYEAALRDGRTVVAVRTRSRPMTLRVVEALRAAGGHFINHFGRGATEEFARWHGPEPNVPSLMKH
jgi:hypothetical protein